ncbi:hypothetical protein JR334_02015 [Clostridia bacterium]|nr:hypothetical protein JR334_02015 [Clostridia bacterium]
MMIKFNPNTPLEMYEEQQAYIEGKGNDASWVAIGETGKLVHFCEWGGSYGDRATAAEAKGVKDSATLRMVYNPTVYAALRTSRVVIVKNLDPLAVVDDVPNQNNPNVYELWGGVDNIKNENQFMEFKVRRYEGK